MFLLDVQHISKSFQNNLALQDVSLSLEKNKIYGLLGPNGAGKTTLIRNITQIFFPDAGQIFFNGEKLSQKHQNQIGYMPEERGLYKKMKVGEQLLYFAQLRDFSKAEAEQKINYWLKKLDIESWRNKTIEELSKGMQQKIQFVATILHEPTLLILDEPFSGLDPINAELIKNEIFELHQKGTTIIFSTHRMENVEEICEDIFLINKGKIILDGNVQAIKHQFKKQLIKVDTNSTVLLNDSILSQTDITEQADTHLIFKLKENQKANDILKVLLQNNIEISGMTEILPTINEIFIQSVNNN
ncbi:MAG: ATP-binding cassette domain-containing protein [Sphingobacteriales bacterium]|nr:ATP-binding cassette domain-containing protein [Sphingobacteriales bacterium]HNY55417.1 ATP-binding cassette domain-containing protein [Chitinophagales bacterium]